VSLQRPQRPEATDASSPRPRTSHADALVGPELPPVGRAHVRIVRASMGGGLFDRVLRFGQRTAGATWIEECTKHIRHVHGLSRLPWFDPKKSYIVVTNHRSFFDLYVISAYLVKRGLGHRIMFPVRSNFFYDNPAGILVNAVMSFFAMYPPIFRDRSKAHLNVASLDETIRLLEGGGMFVGLHPEGTRNQSDDPYTLLPAQSGVGRIIHAANQRVETQVIPAFVNGLINDLPKQVVGNFTGDGNPIHVVFGAPIDFGELLRENPSPRVSKRISEICLERVAELGQEEKAHRARGDQGCVR
jgi:1-acyl-sn-glycerol-3-phosphate acyltransferase